MFNGSDIHEIMEWRYILDSDTLIKWQKVLLSNNTLLPYLSVTLQKWVSVSLKCAVMFQSLHFSLNVPEDQCALPSGKLT